jgi:peptide deformylase
MSIREIVTPPDPVLRSTAEKVRAFNSELRELADDMVETMRSARGVGLAAPQVGISKRLIVVEYAEPPEDPEAEPPEPELYRVINPELIRTGPDTALGNEGCLSLPGLMGEVERSTWALVRGFTPAGEPAQIRAEGWLARIFLHEIDHLNGVLFIDRANEVWEIEEEEDEAEAAARV